MSSQYDQQLQEVVDILLQQNDAFDARTPMIAKFCKVSSSALSATRPLRNVTETGTARHPITPVVNHPQPTVDEPRNSYTRRVPFDEPRISDIVRYPNFGAVKPILQQTHPPADPWSGPGFSRPLPCRSRSPRRSRSGFREPFACRWSPPLLRSPRALATRSSALAVSSFDSCGDGAGGEDGS
ncbi:hypothetical protein B0H14DRAFT_2653844 [Mycena olivaceomarginata]|nr:hypothetical protein B0H14DRAFT_2653844 [Mycena olivaceomarginata]